MKKPTREEAKNAILAMCRDSLKPLLIGVAAARLSCWSIRETEDLFEELLADGLLRPITKEEKSKFDLREGYVLPV